MAWVKLDDNFAEHPKFHNSGNLYPLLLALQVASLCYAARYLTDGLIPKRQALLMAGQVATGVTVQDDNGDPLDMTAALLVNSMLQAGLWERATTGYQIHDYAHWNWTKAQVEQSRQARAERQRRFRARNDGGNEARNVVTNDAGNAVGNDDGMGMGIGTKGSPAQAHAQEPPQVMMGFRPKKATLTEEQEQAAALARRLNRAWIKAGMPRNEDGTPKMPENFDESAD